jgi:hypothetical protein
MIAWVECGQLFKSVNPKAKSKSSVWTTFRGPKKFQKKLRWFSHSSKHTFSLLAECDYKTHNMIEAPTN